MSKPQCQINDKVQIFKLDSTIWDLDIIWHLDFVI